MDVGYNCAFSFPLLLNALTQNVFDLFDVCRLASHVHHTWSLQHSCEVKGALGGHDLLGEVPLLSLPGYPPLLCSVSIGSLPPEKDGHEDDIIASKVPPKQLRDKRDHSI